MPRRVSVFIVLASATVALGLTSVPAQAGPAGCNRQNNTPKKLLQCVTLGGVREHQQAWQQIANANGGNRFSGLPGHDASVDYVVDRLEAAGYSPTVQPFDYLAFAVLGPSTLQQTAPGSITYVEDVDYTLLDQTDPGDATALVTAVDLMLGLGNTSTSGCEAGDFAAFPAGNIALVQRGTCFFEDKVENAAAAGAVGVIVMNQGNTEERKGLAAVTLGASNTSGIPARVHDVRSRSRMEHDGRAEDAPHRRHSPRDQDDVQRARRDELGRRPERRDGRRPPRLRFRRARGSTTTGPEAARSSRWPSRWPR